MKRIIIYSLVYLALSAVNHLLLVYFGYFDSSDAAAICFYYIGFLSGVLVGYGVFLSFSIKILGESEYAAVLKSFLLFRCLAGILYIVIFAFTVLFLSHALRQAIGPVQTAVGALILYFILKINGNYPVKKAALFVFSYYFILYILNIGFSGYLLTPY